MLCESVSVGDTFCNTYTSPVKHTVSRQKEFRVSHIQRRDTIRCIHSIHCFSNFKVAVTYNIYILNYFIFSSLATYYTY